jgi:formate--tetrahydrofolate ligase
MEDIEIARNTKLKEISMITDELNIPNKYVEPYGHYKAKINLEYLDEISDNKNGKLILTTSINPTPLGEGKTTMAIGIADALRAIGKKSILALREPSLGPVFGIKGGATGGGYSQVAPMEDINLHFTGDLHAITCANNLLSAMIDNHIFQGNAMQIERVTWKRCLDLNDRALRTVTIGQSGEKNMIPREDGFDITAASEIMAILCLATSVQNLKERLGNILIGYNVNGNPVYCKDINAHGAMTVVLKDALNPNIVQTLEHTPAIIHGGPFANIAHGCNSILATNMALKLGDYVVTEAGFGADLGAEKFLDIKRRKLEKNVDCVVVVATIKALKYHGGLSKDEVKTENIEALRKGFNNLKHHIDVIKNVYNLKPIVAINKFGFDTENEITTLKSLLDAEDVEMSLDESFAKGSEGAIDLANKIVEICDNSNADNEEKKYSYNIEEDVVSKFENVAKNVYGAEGVTISDEALAEIKKIENMGYSKFPVCIAKTQYSLSDDDKNLLVEEPFTINIREVRLRTGAEFIVGITGKLMTMPGLPKTPAAERIDIDDDENIVGIF